MGLRFTAWIRRVVGRHDRPLTLAHAVGQWGEKTAERFLRKKRYRILGRRLKIGKRDEIDLVARDGDILVFVEVKARKTEDFGRPASAVDRRKRTALSRAAVAYLRALDFPDVSFRFDIVEVVGELKSPDAVVRHIENAFPLDRKYQLPY